MPRMSPSRRCLDGYVDYLVREARYAERTVKEYRWAIIRCHDIIREGNGPENPERVREKDLRYLLDHLTGSTGNRKYYWTAYCGFLRWVGNEAIKSFRPRWPPVNRVRVDWLEPEQANALREAAFRMDPLTALLVHLELDLLLRRIEIMRLKVQDIHRDHMTVLGKGRMGGKPRTVSLVPDESWEIIGRYLEYRRQLEAQTNGPQTDALVVYLRDGKLHPFKRSALDNRLKALQTETGIGFLGHHTLRRTGGRLMWLAGVPVETISSIYGHESTEMTLRYIGVNLSDQARAFEAVRNLRIQLQKTAENVPFVSVPDV
ncbi:MAG: site-specific integrase [Thermoplasmata archaeon]